MKSILYIGLLAVMLLSSCATGGLYMSSEYDDMYYLPSDKPAVRQEKAAKQEEGNNSQGQYYDNKYAQDTLIAEEYNDAVDYDNAEYYSKDNDVFEYYDDYSYSNRLRRFYGNYFDPYWRDPFYSFGYGYGYPYSYYSFDPFWDYGYYSPYYYGGYYGFYSPGFGLYRGYYNPYYYYPYSYGGYYSSWYGYHTGGNEYNTVGVARRERYSTMTSNYRPTPSQRSSYTSQSGGEGGQRRTSTTVNPTESRRGDNTLTNTRQGLTDQGRANPGYQMRRDVNNTSQTANQRPSYSQTNRSYTPSYTNPRMSERPSYNNTRVTNQNQGQGQGQGNNANYQNTSRTGVGNTSTYRNNPNNFSNSTNRSSSYSSGAVRTSPSNSGNYSSPSRSSYSGTSSGSRSYDSGSGSRSSYSGSSYSGSSGGGYSGGSSSSGSSSSSSSSSGGGGRSSGGTRR